MKPIEITFKFFDEEHRARFYKSEYIVGRNLYIGVVTWNEENEYWESWGNLTTNLPGMCLDKNEAFLDTNNCAHEIIAALMDKGYIKDTGMTRQSGFCTYPLVEFTEEFLNGMYDEGDDENE